MNYNGSVKVKHGLKAVAKIENKIAEEDKESLDEKIGN